MELQYEQLHTLPLLRRIKAAHTIAKVVCAEAANDKMKRVKASELLARKFSLIALDGQRVAGHVSVEGPVVGALYVDSEYRGQHIATRLVAAATDFVLAEGQAAVAYCNETSVRAFANCGYIEMQSDKLNRTKMVHPTVPIHAMQELTGELASLTMAA